MAVSRQSQQDRIGSDSAALAAARSRRLLYGGNVAMMIAAATAIVIVLNAIAYFQYRRFDVANAGLYSLSDRTKRVLADCPAKELTLTSVYTSSEKGKDRKTFLPRVRDLFDELQAQGHSLGKTVTAQHLTDDEDKRKLIERVQGKFSGQSTQHKEAIDLAKAKWAELNEKLTASLAAFRQLTVKKQWLGSFTTFTKTQADLQTDLQELQDTLKDVESLTGGTMAMPRYDEAGRKIKETNEKIKGHVESAQKWLKELDTAAAGLRDPNSEFAKKTQENLKKINDAAAELNKAIGDPSDTTIPEDPKPSLQAFSRAAAKLAALMAEEGARVDSYVDKHQALRGHNRYAVRVNAMFSLELPDLLTQSGRMLSDLDQQIRGALAGDQPKDVLQSAVRQLREACAAQVAPMIEGWGKSIVEFLASFQKMDDASRQILEQAKADKFLGDEMAALKAVGDKFAALPEMKTEDLATKFEQDNLVVVETADMVKVVDFDTLWPRAESAPGMPGEDDAERRVFNGDAAISATLLTLAHKEPFATVILTFFEPQAPQEQMQMRQQPPRTGQIPSREMSKLKERLEQANFKVKDWNLAGEDAAVPAPEPNTKPIYVFLPPAPASQENPFQQPNPNERKFGDADIERVRNVLKAENARGVFVTSFLWPMRSFFGPPTPVAYGFDKLLREDWGVAARTDERVIRGVPSKRDAKRYEVSVTRWNWMRINMFNKEHPIGEPMRARRMLMTDVCPVESVAKDKMPADVSVRWVLSVPGTSGRSEFWAEKDVISLISQIQGPKSDGTVLKSEMAIDPPFSVILTAENAKTKGKIIAMGVGMSLIDDYMAKRVPRLGEEGRISFDPEPRENGDLFVNGVFWLADKADLIGAGPVTAPPIEPITSRGWNTLAVVTFGWAALVLVLGGAMMLVRRK